MTFIKNPLEIKAKLDTDEGKSWIALLNDLSFKSEMASYEANLAAIRVRVKTYEYHDWLGIPLSDKEKEDYKSDILTLENVKFEEY